MMEKMKQKQYETGTRSKEEQAGMRNKTQEIIEHMGLVSCTCQQLIAGLANRYKKATNVLHFPYTFFTYLKTRGQPFLNI